MINLEKIPFDEQERKEVLAWLAGKPMERIRALVESKLTEVQVEMANAFEEKGEKEGFQEYIAAMAQDRMLPLRHFLDTLNSIMSTGEEFYTVKPTTTYAGKR
jgi:hypothetical protein